MEIQSKSLGRKYGTATHKNSGNARKHALVQSEEKSRDLAAADGRSGIDAHETKVLEVANKCASSVGESQRVT